MGVNQQIEFVDTDFDTPPTVAPGTLRRCYQDTPLALLLAASLTDAGFTAERYDDLLGAATHAAGRMQTALGGPATRIEVVQSLFFRGKGAYLIGCAFAAHDESCLPFGLVLQHGEGGIVLDAVLTGEDDIAILFSFTRSYFRVDVERPYELVHLRIKQGRFRPDLLQELLRGAGGSVRIEEGHLVIRHVYMECRVRPLNLYLCETSDAAARAAVRDYGQAIWDLAATNIFPGDLLLKNFGVTRHGRVVFYDYDELCLLTDCKFRELPTPASYEEEIAPEPWFSVREGDIFPEEFPRFLGLRPTLRDELLTFHGVLFTPEAWRRMQTALREGVILEILPYDESRRLTPPYDRRRGS